jgi:hypothetical protein
MNQASALLFINFFIQILPHKVRVPKCFLTLFKKIKNKKLEGKLLHTAWCRENVGFDQVASLNTVQNLVA